MSSSDQPLQVVVAGGGVAAIEVLLALRDLAGERVDVTLVSADEEFEYRPLQIAEPFSLDRAQNYSLRDIAKDQNARFIHDRVVEASPSAHTVHLKTGLDLPYDALVIAIGAKADAAFEHAITITLDEREEALHGLLEDLEKGFLRRVAFIVPPDSTWVLPLYEVALMTAREIWSQGVEDVELTFITPEERPLGLFGTHASSAVANLLDEAGIKFEGSSYAEVERDVVLLRPHDRRIEVDRVVALPSLRGQTLTGIPCEQRGFIPTDAYGRVTDVDDIFAAGDNTSFPIKQGGLATQQADAVASVIAEKAGAPVQAAPFEPILRGMLLTGGQDRFMRQEAGGGAGEGEFAVRPLWWPPNKIVGRYITAYLYRLDEAEVLTSVPTEHIFVEEKLDLPPS